MASDYCNTLDDSTMRAIPHSVELAFGGLSIQLLHYGIES